MPDVQGSAASIPPDPTRAPSAFRRLLARSFDSSRPAPGSTSEETRLLTSSREPGIGALAVLDRLPEPVPAAVHLGSTT